MLRKFRNRKPSSDSKSTTRRNRQRRIRFEALQERQLMAADFGGFADFYGPQLPNAENTAAVVATTTSAATTNTSNAATTDRYYHVSISRNDHGSITLNGTVFNDVVNITLFGGSDRDLLDGGDDNVNDQLFGGTGNDIFIRHKHVWSADDPDEFRDFSAAQADEVFNDWLSPNFGNDFPV